MLSLLVVYLCFVTVKSSLSAVDSNHADVASSVDASSDDLNPDCDLYLAPSTIRNAGRGIIAGKSFQLDDVVDVAPVISFRNSHSDLMQFINYVYPSNYKGYNMHIFGPSSLYNHMHDKTVQNEWSPDEDDLNDSLTNDFTTHKTCTHIVLKPVRFGEEMFTTYGDKWFEQRGMVNTVLDTCNASATSVEQDLDDAESHDTPSNEQTATCSATNNEDTTGRPLTRDELRAHGQCVSDVYVGPSLHYRAGRGLFASRSFRKGDVVTVSPVLTIPKSVVEQTVNDSVLMNYCLSVEGSEVALFPLGYAAMANHASFYPPNMQVQWHNWANSNNASSYGARLGNVFDVRDKLALTPAELFDAPFAQLDLAYVAVEDIVAGEELTVDCGEDWMNAWEEYLEETLRWEGERDKWDAVDDEEKEELSPHPVFRQYMEAPDRLFPEHWMN